MLAHVFSQLGLQKAIEERVRFARARMGDDEVIDFVVMLLGYAVSGERTLQAFYHRLLPFAEPFMALFGRANLPHPATLSRDLSALEQAPVEALRTLFQEDLVARSAFASPAGGVWDRQGRQWTVVDVDGTKQARRQRALPQTCLCPIAALSWSQLPATWDANGEKSPARERRSCKRITHQWLGTFGNAGTGDYRGELLRARAAIEGYASALALPLCHVLTRLDGLYGNAAALVDLLPAGGPGVIVRGKDYHLLNLPAVRARLQQPPDQQTRHASRREPVVRSPIFWIFHSRRPGRGCACSWLRAWPVPPPLPSGQCTTARSLSSSFPPSHQTPSVPPTCLISTCIEGPLRRCSPMKIRNKIPIAGCLIRLVGKSSGKSSRNGSGICAWSSGSTCLLLPCV